MEAEQSVFRLANELQVKEKELAVASHKASGVLKEVTAKAQAAEQVREDGEKLVEEGEHRCEQLKLLLSAGEAAGAEGQRQSSAHRRRDRSR